MRTKAKIIADLQANKEVSNVQIKTFLFIYENEGVEKNELKKLQQKSPIWNHYPSEWIMGKNPNKKIERAKSPASPAQIRPYLPSNFSVRDSKDGGSIIEGEPTKGWTMDGYVIPRLASGLIGAVKI